MSTIKYIENSNDANPNVNSDPAGQSYQDGKPSKNAKPSNNKNNYKKGKGKKSKYHQNKQRDSSPNPVKTQKHSEIDQLMQGDPQNSISVSKCNTFYCTVPLYVHQAKSACTFITESQASDKPQFTINYIKALNILINYFGNFAIYAIKCQRITYNDFYVITQQLSNSINALAYNWSSTCTYVNIPDGAIIRQWCKELQRDTVTVPDWSRNIIRELSLPRFPCNDDRLFYWTNAHQALSSLYNAIILINNFNNASSISQQEGEMDLTEQDIINLVTSLQIKIMNNCDHIPDKYVNITNLLQFEDKFSSQAYGMKIMFACSVDKDGFITQPKGFRKLNAPTRERLISNCIVVNLVIDPQRQPQTLDIKDANGLFYIFGNRDGSKNTGDDQVDMFKKKYKLNQTETQAIKSWMSSRVCVEVKDSEYLDLLTKFAMSFTRDDLGYRQFKLLLQRLNIEVANMDTRWAAWIQLGTKNF